MEQTSMTALISAFARAFHSQNNETAVFHDDVARQLFTDEEYQRISDTMSAGIGFFNPAFNGNSDQALRWIVDNQLSPVPLGRAAFAENSLERAAQIGAGQYLILGAGYDTFAYRQPVWANALQIFEIDRPAAVKEKQERLEKAGITIPANVYYIEADFAKSTWHATLLQHKAFDCTKRSFSTALGVFYYLSEQDFNALLSDLSSILPKGSSLLFDYPDETSYTAKAGPRASKQAMLAEAANEKMLASYSYREMERLLAAHGFLVYEHLTPREMTAQYFSAYNSANPSHCMAAFDHVNYCLAVKQ